MAKKVVHFRQITSYKKDKEILEYEVRKTVNWVYPIGDTFSAKELENFIEENEDIEFVID